MLLKKAQQISCDMKSQMLILSHSRLHYLRLPLNQRWHIRQSWSTHGRMVLSCFKRVSVRKGTTTPFFKAMALACRCLNIQEAFSSIAFWKTTTSDLRWRNVCLNAPRLPSHMRKGGTIWDWRQKVSNRWHDRSVQTEQGIEKVERALPPSLSYP